MPMPMPHPGEMDDAFMSRCMSDETMMRDYEDMEQRAAVCRRQMGGANATATAAAMGRPLRLRARVDWIEAQAAAGEPPKRPTFSIMGYTGAPILVENYYSPVIIDLAGLRPASQQIPALRDHDSGRIVGQTDAVEIGPDGVKLTGIVTGENADAQEVVSQAKNGFRWQASVGVDPVQNRLQFIKRDETATVNGREVSGPMVIAREGVLREISFTALGADSQTSASVAASSPRGTREGTAMQFDDWLKAKGFDPAALVEAQTTSLRAWYDAESKTPATGQTPSQQFSPGGHGDTPAPTATLQQIVEARKAEDRRIAEITAIAQRWINERPTQVDEIQRIAESAIAAKGTTPDQTELTLIRGLRASAAPAVHVRDSRTAEKTITATVCRSAGLRNIETHFDEKTLEASDRQFRHGIGLQELLLLAARENGFTGHSCSDLEAVLHAAFPGRGMIRAEGFSTLSLPGILSNVANKFLAQSFTAVESGWQSISTSRPVKDFKAVTSYSLTGDMTYDEVGPTGELKHGTLSELSYTNQAKSYGKIYAVPRTVIINDDLGALMQIPQKLGRGAALKINDVFWKAFLAGVGSFWAAGNNNLSSGAGSALASAGLTAALLKFRKQTDPDGKPLGLTPRILLVPPDLEVTADELMLSTAINTGGAATETKVPNRNIWTAKFRTVTSTYLSNTAYTNYSTAAWWLLADPQDLSTIEVAFLNGRQMPIVENADAEFDTLGIQFRAYHDFGVALQEARASVRSAGS